MGKDRPVVVGALVVLRCLWLRLLGVIAVACVVPPSTVPSPVQVAAETWRQSLVCSPVEICLGGLPRMDVHGLFLMVL